MNRVIVAAFVVGTLMLGASGPMAYYDVLGNSPPIFTLSGSALLLFGIYAYDIRKPFQGGDSLGELVGTVCLILGAIILLGEVALKELPRPVEGTFAILGPLLVILGAVSWLVGTNIIGRRATE